jgi:hypothetical protein
MRTKKKIDVIVERLENLGNRVWKLEHESKISRINPASWGWSYEEGTIPIREVVFFVLEKLGYTTRFRPGTPAGVDLVPIPGEGDSGKKTGGKTGEKKDGGGVKK